MKIFISILCLVLLGVLFWDIVKTYFLIQKSKALIEQAVPFERLAPEASKKFLILGDSTAVGVGATNSEDSTAGRLAKMYNEAEVINFAESGQKISGLLKVLDSIGAEKRFDIVLIQIGANDIIRLTSMEDIEKGIEKVLTRAQSFGGKIIFLHSGNIGEAEFFPWYVQPLLSRRSLEVREIYKKQASIHNAMYVDLIDSPVSKLLRENPSRYYANDLLHLTGEGYALWFEEIQKKLEK